jgi:SAM-dependent methyltransferase
MELKVQNFSEFDSPEAIEFVASRQTLTKALLGNLRSTIQLSSAADVGCGVGYFSKLLHDLGFHVTGIDGREENVQEARRRFPDLSFRAANAEDVHVEKIGTFDLVLCFGLLYHLENPFRAIRNLHSITRKVLLIESMCAPGRKPRMELLDEYQVGNQGLNYVAFYPTETCLVKMLYRAGFPFVYGFATLPDHELFRKTAWSEKRRTMLIAADLALDINNIRLLREPTRPWDIWTTPYERMCKKASDLVGWGR